MARTSTLQALTGMIKRMEAINAKTATSETREETRKKALDNLILQELALQEAERRGLHVEEQTVDRAMERFITSMGHEEGYNDYLEKQKITAAEVRAQFERSLLLQRITGMEVVSKATVTEDDVRTEYEQHKDQYLSPEKVTVADVVVSLKSGDQTAMKKANELLARLNADKDKDPLQLVRDDTFSVRSLDLEKEKEPELYAAARQLKQGELSGVIKMSDSVHIVKLTRHTPERQLSYEEVKGTLTGVMPSVQAIRVIATELKCNSAPLSVKILMKRLQPANPVASLSMAFKWSVAGFPLAPLGAGWPSSSTKVQSLSVTVAD